MGGIVGFFSRLFGGSGSPADSGSGRIQASTAPDASASAVLRVMLAVAAADEVIEDAEVQRILQIYRQIFELELQEDWVRAAAESIGRDADSIDAVIREERPRISEDNVPKVFKAAYYVAEADGSIDESESDLIRRVGDALAMDQASIDACFAEIHDQTVSKLR